MLGRLLISVGSGESFKNWFQIAISFCGTILCTFLIAFAPEKKSAWLKVMGFFSREREHVSFNYLISLSLLSPPFFSFFSTISFFSISPLISNFLPLCSIHGTAICEFLFQSIFFSVSSPNMLKRRRIYVSRLFKWLENYFFYRL